MNTTRAASTEYSQTKGSQSKDVVCDLAVPELNQVVGELAVPAVNQVVVLLAVPM